MPWPPTEATDFQIPIEWQLSAGSTPGLESDQLVGTESTSLLDASTGAMAPNALNVYDNPLDILEQIEQQQKAQRQALAPEGAEGKRQQVIELAKQKLGMNYVWGGESDAEGGYDCSGLLWWAFKEVGISMPRVSMAQAERGKRVPISELKPGDLVAWENNPRQVGADHIALYLGDGQILEAPRTGLKVRIRKLSSAELQNLSRTWGVKLDY
jgi:cell wall-associated NlpC family hydrolase